MSTLFSRRRPQRLPKYVEHSNMGIGTSRASDGSYFGIASNAASAVYLTPPAMTNGIRSLGTSTKTATTTDDVAGGAYGWRQQANNASFLLLPSYPTKRRPSTSNRLTTVHDHKSFLAINDPPISTYSIQQRQQQHTKRLVFENVLDTF